MLDTLSHTQALSKYKQATVINQNYQPSDTEKSPQVASQG